jgi:hypothetical protein
MPQFLETTVIRHPKNSDGLGGLSTEQKIFISMVRVKTSEVQPCCE